MRTFEELDAMWREGPEPPRERGTVRLICLRKGGGVHETPPRARATVEHGLEGDRWSSGDRDREAQITLMNARVAELVAGAHAALDAPGDNLLVDLDLDAAALPPGTRVRAGSLLLEVSGKPHTGCKKFRERFGLPALAWVNEGPARRRRGVNCRVVEGGEVAVGDPVAVEKKPERQPACKESDPV